MNIETDWVVGRFQEKVVLCGVVDRGGVINVEDCNGARVGELDGFHHFVYGSDDSDTVKDRCNLWALRYAFDWVESFLQLGNI